MTQFWQNGFPSFPSAAPYIHPASFKAESILSATQIDEHSIRNYVRKLVAWKNKTCMWLVAQTVGSDAQDWTVLSAVSYSNELPCESGARQRTHAVNAIEDISLTQVRNALASEIVVVFRRRARWMATLRDMSLATSPKHLDCCRNELRFKRQAELCRTSLFLLSDRNNLSLVFHGSSTSKRSGTPTVVVKSYVRARKTPCDSPCFHQQLPVAGAG